LFNKLYEVFVFALAAGSESCSYMHFANCTVPAAVMFTILLQIFVLNLKI